MSQNLDKDTKIKKSLSDAFCVRQKWCDQIGIQLENK